MWGVCTLLSSQRKQSACHFFFAIVYSLFLHLQYKDFKKVFKCDPLSPVLRMEKLDCQVYTCTKLSTISALTISAMALGLSIITFNFAALLVLLNLFHHHQNKPWDTVITVYMNQLWQCYYSKFLFHSHHNTHQKICKHITQTKYYIS